MFKDTGKLQNVIRIATIATLSFMICAGFVLVLAQIKPFWVDEWRVIYNLKYKTALTLWGPLDYLQQFPRVYLEIIKAFASPFDYSYFTLRFPSFLTGVCTIVFCFRLMKNIYPVNNFNRFLFVMILVSSYTFTEYFVQIKQYTMDILLSLVALWQYIELIKYNQNYLPGKRRYLLLIITFLIVPFFSYTYPIAVAPVFIIIPLAGIQKLYQHAKDYTLKSLLAQLFPLSVGFISIVVFYVTDVSQLMADQGMHQFWGHLMMDRGFELQSFAWNFYKLFAQVGSGLLFSVIFGILGVFSFAFGIYSCVRLYTGSDRGANTLLLLYATLLLIIVTVLFVAGKLPVGEPRLNAFTIPSISILIIHFLDSLRKRAGALKFATILSVILYAGVVGNIYTTFFAGVTGPEYTKKLDIYVSTENAIILAQAKKLPIFITPDVAYPYEHSQNLPFQNTVPGDWVLKTFPAYKVDENTPVYALNNISELKEYMKQLPSSITCVLAGDGRAFQVVER